MAKSGGTRFLLNALSCQTHFLQIVRDLNWKFDATTGQLSIGRHYCWHSQVLGSESIASQTWLWAWANTESNIPAHLLVASLALKAYGEQHCIPELTTPQLPLDQIDGHTLALLASGICEANAYYRCPYDGGALYVLIMDESFPKCPDPPLQRVATVFPQAIASLDIPDHEAALCGYLDHYDLEHEHTDNQIIVRGEGGEPLLTATFDGLPAWPPDASAVCAQAEGTEQGMATEDMPPEDNPVRSTPIESWDEAQLRRMLGG